MSNTFSLIPIVNIHTHRKPKTREWALRNAWLPEKCSIDPKPGYFISVGIHPWFADKITIENIDKKMKNILSNEIVKAIGEIGLDRVNGPSFDIQKNIFEHQLHIAEKYNKPVIIHSVKSYADILSYVKSSKTHFILHDYQGNKQTTDQFLHFEHVYFSFGKLLFRNPESASAILKIIPANRIFFETDTMNISIAKVYEKASEMLSINQEILYKTVFDNFIRVI